MEAPLNQDRKYRVMVVDDSAAGRAAISEMLVQAPNIEIVGWAMDGREALKLVHSVKPDLITLDLEMPRMDGFTFLRMLRAQQPTPVIVVSSNSRPEASILALELGAFDFVVKPNRMVGQSLASLGQELIQKIAVAVGSRLTVQPEEFEEGYPGTVTLAAMRLLPERVKLVTLGASTGGPVTVQNILKGIPDRLDFPIVIAQHMPARFTKAFAERLDRLLPHRVREAENGAPLLPGEVLIAPGAKRTTVSTTKSGIMTVRIEPPGGDQYSPSIDHLFSSAAPIGLELVAIVLTGMGSDGAKGAHDVEDNGGIVITESPETAMISGMPEEAAHACISARVLRADQIARLLWSLGGESR